MPQFPYVITVESSEAPTPEARDMMITILAEQGFTDVQLTEGKLRVAGANAARADQLAFTLREKLAEVWRSTTVLVSEPQKQAEE